MLPHNVLHDFLRSTRIALPPVAMPPPSWSVALTFLRGVLEAGDTTAAEVFIWSAGEFSTIGRRASIQPFRPINAREVFPGRFGGGGVSYVLPTRGRVLGALQRVLEGGGVLTCS